MDETSEEVHRIGWVDQNEETLSINSENDVDSDYEYGELWTHVYRRDRPEAPFSESLHEIEIGVTDPEQSSAEQSSVVSTSDMLSTG